MIFLLIRGLSKIMPSWLMKMIGNCDGMDFLGFGTILFGSKSSSSSSLSSTTTMETIQRTDLGAGLKALTAPPPHLNRSCINRADLMSSSSVPLISSSSSLMKKTYEKKKKKKREFPPPIPLLARTENLPCHMPWVLKRCYTKGRLVLREVPVKHHEYFKAERSNGRLVLRIMYMADDHLAFKENNVPQHVLDDDDNVVHEDATPSKSLMNDEEICLEQNTPAELDYNVCDRGGDDAGGSDGDVDMESTCHRENGLDVNQDEEVGASSPVVEEKQQVQQQQQHKVLNNVLNESNILSSSMPEARLWCLPKDTKNDFFRIGTPTIIRPIYI